MSIVTTSDFVEWKANPVTKAFFMACQERILDGLNELSLSAGLNPVQDNVIRGMIKAFREVQEFHIEDLEEFDNA